MQMLRLDSIPLFPLPNTVLIPGGILPLHVFEERYRELVSDCLDGDRVFAVARLTDSDGNDGLGQPPIYPVVGVGRVESHQQLSDGRYLLLLHGWLRARVLDELASDKPYRLARAEPIADDLSPASDPLEPAAQALRQMVLQLAHHHESEPARLLASACAAEGDPGRLADLVGAALLADPGQRQGFLEQQRVSRRLELLTDQAAQVLARAASSNENATLH